MVQVIIKNTPPTQSTHDDPVIQCTTPHGEYKYHMFHLLLTRDHYIKDKVVQHKVSCPPEV